MPTNNDIENWAAAQEYPIRLDNTGRIIDFIDENIKRSNTPEERVRQQTVQMLHYELRYPKEIIGIERNINIGREHKRVDIAIFSSPEAQAANDQGQLLIVGETKAPTEQEPDGQFTSYISATSAEGGFWTSGSKILFYRKNLANGLVIPWLGIPKYGFAWDSVGRFRKSDLINPIDLKVVFKRCHNALYRSGIDSEDIALDMVRIILAKVEDESSASEDCLFQITPDEFNNPELRKRACERVRKLYSNVKNRFPEVFFPYEEISASNDQLAIVISYLQPYSFLEATSDVIGTAYEVYVASHLKGERGQYFTNRLVVNMMVEILNPGDSDIVLDPACGSGGFLIASMNHINKKIDVSNRSDQAKVNLKRNVSNNLFGVDTTPKLVKVAKANMLISKDGHTGIIQGNSLASFNLLPENFSKKAGRELPTIVMTNPPFGSGFDLRIKEADLLINFLNGHNWSVNETNEITYLDSLNTNYGVPPEVLFLERCIQWVKPGGYIGIVMAKGQLDNREAISIRNFVFQNCKVLAVVNLHEDTFEPFVGAKASVLFLQKKLPNTTNDYRIFMAISNKVGQTSRGVPIYKKNDTGDYVIENNSFVLDEDLSDIAHDYKRFVRGELEETAYRFSISCSEIIKDTLSINPVQYLPSHNEALRYVLSLGDSDDFEIHRLGDLANVYNGPRFKRPYADSGVTEGPTIQKYFTGTALTQYNSDNIKYLDRSKASPQTRRHLENLVIYKGYILISDSGTLGRISYALSIHHGHLATNNLIRVVIEDNYLRGYVYQFLKSPLGQHLILKNAYGTNQEHLEPDVIAEIPIPIPKDREVINRIGRHVLDSIESLERFIAESDISKSELINQFRSMEIETIQANNEEM